MPCTTDSTPASDETKSTVAITILVPAPNPVAVKVQTVVLDAQFVEIPADVEPSLNATATAKAG